MQKHRPAPKLTPKSIARFQAGYEQAGPDECWEWRGGRDTKGYGYFCLNGLNYRAHRISHQLSNGAFPAERCICHKCDNPPCVNPAHLFAGDHAANTRDMVAKGRHGQKRKTHCIHGHPFDERNTIIGRRGTRDCRACILRRQRRRRQRLREQKRAVT